MTTAPNKLVQYSQLAVLTLMHAMCDLCPGMIPALVPHLRTEFSMTIKQGVWLIAILHLVCNFVQIGTGHMRNKRENCFFIPLGVTLAASLLFIGFLPTDAIGRGTLFVITIIAASGVAIVHPEALRAVHRLDAIPSSISSAVFLTGGFFGFAGGAFLTTKIVENYNLQALAWLALAPAISIALVYILRVKLAVEPAEAEVDLQDPQTPPKAPALPSYSFWPLFFMAVPSAIAGVLIVGLVPLRLNELGFDLSDGGKACMFFGIGGATGGLFWAFVGKNKPEVPFCALTSLLGAPLILTYLSRIEYPSATWLFLAGGFFVNGAVTLAVTAARHARGLNIGQRMAFMVGGTWGTGSVVLLALGPLIPNYIQIQTVLYFAAFGYAISGLVGIFIILRRRLLAAKLITS